MPVDIEWFTSLAGLASAQSLPIIGDLNEVSTCESQRKVLGGPFNVSMGMAGRPRTGVEIFSSVRLGVLCNRLTYSGTCDPIFTKIKSPGATSQGETRTFTDRFVQPRSPQGKNPSERGEVRWNITRLVKYLCLFPIKPLRYILASLGSSVLVERQQSRTPQEWVPIK